MSSRPRWVFPAVTAAVLASPGAASGQVVERAFDVQVGGGAILHQNASALVPASPLMNLRARYFLTPTIGLGVSMDYGRTHTDDDIFPLGQFRFTTADSTIFVAMMQPVALFHYEVIGTVGKARGRLYPYAQVGVGGYTLYLDPQQNEGPARMSDLLFSLGGAVKVAFGESAGLELAVRDVIYTGYDRELLNLVPDRTCREGGEQQFTGTVCPNERFPLLDPERSDPNWSPPKSTLHNFVVTVAFSLIPGQ